MAMTLTDPSKPAKSAAVDADPQNVVRADLDHVTGGMLSAGAGCTLDLSGLAYRRLGSELSRALAAEVDHTLATRHFRQSGDFAPEVWQQGWSEVAQRLRTEPLTTDSLRPGYFRDERHFRFDGRYVEALAPLVEYRTSVAVRQVLFARYLAAAPQVVELGCGTGLNVLLLAQAYPGMRIVGCDWVPASQEIMAIMERSFPGRIAGERLDMLTADGWDGAGIGCDTVLLTVHALEQLHTNWRTCLDFILARRPRLCLHVEPLAELYDPAAPDDARMLRYHRKRRYLEGFLPEIQRLASEGRAEIVELRRIAFSGLYHEAYSVLAWRPL
jgi:hypothetical protein